MQPITIPEVANSNPLWIIFLAVGGALIIGGILLAIWRQREAFFLISGVGLVSMFFVAMPMQIMGHPTWYDRHEAQAKEASVQIEDSYGLELSSAEIIDLDWPEKAPSKSFKVYGSVVNQKQVEGAKFIERTVYLVWADGKLQLSESEDGKSFDELEATK
jgi:hypothetical protein